MSSNKYLLAIINSKFANHFLNNIRKHRLENYFYPDDFRKLLIRKIDLETQKIFEILVDYLTFLRSIELVTSRERLIPIYFEQIIDAMVYELYFEESVKKSEKDIIKYFSLPPNSLSKIIESEQNLLSSELIWAELTPITKDMKSEEKMKIISYHFNRLDSINHPVRNNIFFMDSIEEIRIIQSKK